MSAAESDHVVLLTSRLRRESREISRDGYTYASSSAEGNWRDALLGGNGELEFGDLFYAAVIESWLGARNDC